MGQAVVLALSNVLASKASETIRPSCLAIVKYMTAWSILSKTGQRPVLRLKVNSESKDDPRQMPEEIAWWRSRS